MIIKGRADLAASMLLVAGLLAGCADEGSADSTRESPPTEAETLAKSPPGAIEMTYENAMRSLAAVHIRADLRTKGRRVELDVSLSHDGDCEGMLSADGMEFELATKGERRLFRPANHAAYAGFFGARADVVSKFMDGRWLIDDLGLTTKACNLSRFFEKSFESEEPLLEVVGLEEIDGVPVLELEGEHGGTAVVRGEAPHYLVRAENSAGTMEFSDFNTDVHVDLPAPRKVLDLDDVPAGPARPRDPGRPRAVPTGHLSSQPSETLTLAY